jgi:excisionase family DNA binding protein
MDDRDGTDGRTLTLDQAAARLGISRDAMRKRLERGGFPGAVKLVGRPWSVPADALDAPTVRPSTVMSGRMVQSDASELLSELRAIRAALTDGRDAPRPGRPAPWWRWLLFGEVRRADK